MQPKTVAKGCRQTEEKDSHSMLRATLDKVVEYMTNPTTVFPHIVSALE